MPRLLMPALAALVLLGAAADNKEPVYQRKPLSAWVDQLTDRSVRFIAAELIREKAIRLLGDEIPYGLATTIEQWTESDGRAVIGATVWVERESHRGIVVGAGASKLKEIGRQARLEIERLLEKPVHLDLWVKLCQRWRDDAAQMAQGMGAQLAHFLLPLLVQLDGLLDKRLVRTFLQTIEVIITRRSRAHGLLLSELGAYLETPDKAPAGTKRLSNLLHSTKWGAWIIAQFLWQRATQQLEQWRQAGEEGLVIWDESVWEKPESSQLEGLCAVR